MPSLLSCRQWFPAQSAVAAGLLVLLTPLLMGAPEASPQVRVLCYNIHYGQGTDGTYDIERLAKVIAATQPDLVALQEVDVGVRRSGQVHQVRRLATLTGLAARFGPTQHYEGGLFGNAVLTRLPILDVEIQPLPYTEATPERTTYPRGALAVTVTAPDGKPLRFVSTHFQHNVPEDREAEAEAINRLFGAPANEMRTILAGDINATPESEPIRILLEQWTTTLENPPSPSIPSTQPTSRIDYILHRPGPAFKVLETKVIPESLASDHRPVFAILRLEPLQH